VLEASDGQPIEPGLAPPRRRTGAANLLAQGCCRVCGSTRDLEVHHVISAAEGGRTTPENLVVLCRDHHLEVEAEKRT
jgi:5-methylcytosine-specific restriction endonuclease McrA